MINLGGGGAYRSLKKPRNLPGVWGGLGFLFDSDGLLFEAIDLKLVSISIDIFSDVN